MRISDCSSDVCSSDLRKEGPEAPIMETRANYIMVGCFVLLLAFGLLGFVLWLAQFQFEEEYARYDIVFESSVTGLNEGSPVRYRGVRVGEVLSVDLDPDRPTAIRVTLEVQERRSEE